MSVIQRWRAGLIGAGAVVSGHALVLMTARVIDGEQPVISYFVLSVLFLGVIQLVYVIPLVAYGLWRSRNIAIGAGAAGVLTLLFTIAGLLY